MDSQAFLQLVLAVYSAHIAFVGSFVFKNFVKLLVKYNSVNTIIILSKYIRYVNFNIKICLSYMN